MKLSRVLFRILGRRLPVTDGERSVDGLMNPVTIRRDEFGIPHIDASNDWDAWFALGFCQGQDRAFQLEWIVRAVRGTMAEAVGVDGIPVDRMSRRVGFKRAADAQFNALDPDIQLMLCAFAEGINAGRQSGLSRQPHEFSILRTSPTAWTASDSLGYLMFTSLAISTNWVSELARYQVLVNDGPDALSAIEPESASWLNVTSPPGATAGQVASSLLEEAEALVDALGIDVGGSNNWVLAGERTASGKPLLANDAHMSPALPAAFYLAHISTPEWSIAGASFAGAPGFYIGHNGHSAWGITVGYLDNTDLFIEEIGADGLSVREGREFVPCEVRDEHIRVRGAGDVIERVLVTDRGPIIGPALAGDVGSVSLSAAWLQPRPARSVLGAHRWRSFEDFHRDTLQHTSISLNIVYADFSGDIGWVLAGEIPQRQGSGALPLPAWETGRGWEGDPVSGARELWMRNPESGFIATANNRPVPQAESAGLGFDWAEGYRVTRINEMLAQRDDWDTSLTLLAQLDTESIPWREIEPLISRVDPVDDDSRNGKELLKRWDGQVSPASTGAALFEVFLSTMMQKVTERAAPASYAWFLERSPAPGLAGNAMGKFRTGHLVHLMKVKPRGWFQEGWNSVIAHSLGDAVRTLRIRFGFHTQRWNWGAVRPLELRHQLGRGPLSGVFNRGPYVIGGDTNTVHAASVSIANPLANVGTVAVARTVIEIGDWDNARFVLLGGQSGNPLSPHYDDQILVWLQGRGVPIAWTPDAVDDAARTKLILTPSLDPDEPPESN